MQTWMKYCVFDRHFEFYNFTDLKQSHRQISLSYSYSAGNLAIENTHFKKSIRICPTLLIHLLLIHCAETCTYTSPSSKLIQNSATIIHCDFNESHKTSNNYFIMG